MWSARGANSPPVLTLAPAEFRLLSVDESPAIKYLDPTPAATPHAAPETPIRHVVPLSAVTYTSPAPVIEFVTPSPVIEYSAPVTCFSPSPQFPFAYTMADLITGVTVDTIRSVNSQSLITDVGASGL